jgi:hypothetical protein
MPVSAIDAFNRAVNWINQGVKVLPTYDKETNQINGVRKASLFERFTIRFFSSEQKIHENQFLVTQGLLSYRQRIKQEERSVALVGRTHAIATFRDPLLSDGFILTRLLHSGFLKAGALETVYQGQGVDKTFTQAVNPLEFRQACPTVPKVVGDVEGYAMSKAARSVKGYVAKQYIFTEMKEGGGTFINENAGSRTVLIEHEGQRIKKEFPPTYTHKEYVSNDENSGYIDGISETAYTLVSKNDKKNVATYQDAQGNLRQFTLAEMVDPPSNLIHEGLDNTVTVWRVMSSHGSKKQRWHKATFDYQGNPLHHKKKVMVDGKTYFAPKVDSNLVWSPCASPFEYVASKQKENKPTFSDQVGYTYNNSDKSESASLNTDEEQEVVDLDAKTNGFTKEYKSVFNAKLRILTKQYTAELTQVNEQLAYARTAPIEETSNEDYVNLVTRAQKLEQYLHILQTNPRWDHFPVGIRQALEKITVHDAVNEITPTSFVKPATVESTLKDLDSLTKAKASLSKAWAAAGHSEVKWKAIAHKLDMPLEALFDSSTKAAKMPVLAESTLHKYAKVWGLSLISAKVLDLIDIKRIPNIASPNETFVGKNVRFNLLDPWHNKVDIERIKRDLPPGSSKVDIYAYAIAYNERIKRSMKESQLLHAQDVYRSLMNLKDIGEGFIHKQFKTSDVEAVANTYPQACFEYRNIARRHLNDIAAEIATLRTELNVDVEENATTPLPLAQRPAAPLPAEAVAATVAPVAEELYATIPRLDEAHPWRPKTVQLVQLEEESMDIYNKTRLVSGSDDESGYSSTSHHSYGSLSPASDSSYGALSPVREELLVSPPPPTTQLPEQGAPSTSVDEGLYGSVGTEDDDEVRSKYDTPRSRLLKPAPAPVLTNINLVDDQLL